jgi:hypothetical protein
VALWILATVATTAVAYVAVNAAGAEVTDRPLSSVVATGDLTSSTSTSTTGASETPTSEGIGGSTSTTAGTTTSSGSILPTTSTTIFSTGSTASTATTAADGPWQQTTIPSKGGLVIVSYRPGEVKLESIAPTPGFSYRIDDEGPQEVRVRFEGGEVKAEVRVRWDGGLVIEVDDDS